MICAGFYALSQAVMAHTTISDNAVEGVTLNTSDAISHGCEYGTKPEMLPVIAQSVVFPNGPDDLVYRSDDPNQEAVNLGDVLSGGAHSHGIINPTLIQNKDIFDQVEQIRDSSGVLRAFHYTNSENSATGGNLPLDTKGLVPFALTGVTFTPESCANKVNVHIAIVDWCTQKPGNRRNNPWFGHATTTFNQADKIPDGFWPNLTISRNVDNNPLPPSCGEGYSITMEPSDTSIDQYLPIPGFIP